MRKILVLSVVVLFVFGLVFVTGCKEKPAPADTEGKDVKEGEGEAAPAEGEAAPAEGEAKPEEGEAKPVEKEDKPAE